MQAAPPLPCYSGCGALTAAPGHPSGMGSPDCLECSFCGGTVVTPSSCLTHGGPSLCPRYWVGPLSPCWGKHCPVPQLHVIAWANPCFCGLCALRSEAPPHHTIPPMLVLLLRIETTLFLALAWAVMLHPSLHELVQICMFVVFPNPSCHRNALWPHSHGFCPHVSLHPVPHCSLYATPICLYTSVSATNTFQSISPSPGPPPSLPPAERNSPRK